MTIFSDVSAHFILLRVSFVLSCLLFDDFCGGSFSNMKCELVGRSDIVAIGTFLAAQRG